MYQSLLSIGLLSLSTLTFADSEFEKELYSGCSQVQNYANNGKKFYVFLRACHQLSHIMIEAR